MLPRVVQLPMLHSELLPLWLCVAACHEVASCCTVDAILHASVLCSHVPYSSPHCTIAATVYATVLCVAAATVYATVLSVAACRTVAYVVQLLPLCMPVFCVAT